MLDRENLLKVAEVVTANEQANERVAAAQVRLEAARAVVETIRTEISEAKDGVSAAKAALDAAVSSVEYTGMSKSAIIKAAEEINRVFLSHGIGLPAAATDEGEPEPEVSRLTLKKLGERVADKIAGFTEGEDASYDRNAVLTLLADIQQVVSDGVPAGKASKDAEASAGKRKRRGKADVASESSETSVADQPAGGSTEFSAAIAELIAADEILIVDTADETTIASAIKAAEIAADAVAKDGQIEYVASIEHVAENATSDDQDAVADDGELSDDQDAVADDGELSDETTAETEVAEIAPVAEVIEISAVDNTHVRDEVIELIDNNVTEDDLSGIVSTVAYAVFLKADAEQTALTVYSYLDLMTVETVVEISAGSDANRLSGELEALASDPEYTAAVLAWFREGVALIEDGKDFPQFTGVASAQVAEEVTPVEIVAAVEEIEEIAEPAADEVFTADQDLPEEVQAVESIGDVDFLSQVEEPARVVDEPVAVVSAASAEAPTDEQVAAQPDAVVAPKSATPFPKPGFMKPVFATTPK
jgi:hypothetical protein